jgi:DNA-binding transcriptional MerR regulator
MPLSRSRDYLSIGEVLDAVSTDFPDVSISKIRFLETEGLIEPERTPSGYRKFFEPDVERLRYILGLQRDHFLPLKVIKERLLSGSNGGDPIPTPAQAPAAPSVAESAAGSTVTGGSTSRPSPDVNLSASEIGPAAGLNDKELQGLIEFGILDGTKDVYDGDDLIAAKAAAGLFRYGVEPRHLKMYRHFAERESAFFEQIVSPVTRRRDPQAQQEATRSINEIIGLAQSFRDAMLRSTMRDLL